MLAIFHLLAMNVPAIGADLPSFAKEGGLLSYGASFPDIFRRAAPYVDRILRRKMIEAEGVRDFQRTVSQGISDSYLRWRGIEATLQLAQSNNSKVVIIGSAKDGLPIILGNSDTPPSSGAGQTAPKKDDSTAKEITTSPAVSTEKTSATAPTEKLTTAGSGTAEAATPAPSSSSWPLSLSDIEAFLARMVQTPASRAEREIRTPPKYRLNGAKTAMREDGTVMSCRHQSSPVARLRRAGS